MFNKKRLIICLLFIFLNAYSEVSTSIDTVDYLKVNGNKVKLNNQFIIESSLSINGEINPVFPITIFPISGYLLLPDTLQSQKLVVKYKFLPFGLPTSIGPKWKLLPQLNQIMNIH